jgi:hypothetical protein
MNVLRKSAFPYKIAVFLAIGTSGEQPKYLLMDKWIKKLW